jgi:hypothetical protein
LIVIEYFHNPVCPHYPAAKSLVTKVIEGVNGIELIDVRLHRLGHTSGE